MLSSAGIMTRRCACQHEYTETGEVSKVQTTSRQRDVHRLRKRLNLLHIPDCGPGLSRKGAWFEDVDFGEEERFVILIVLELKTGL